MMDRVKEFSSAAGLKVNQMKCFVYFGGVSEDVEKSNMETTGFCKGNISFKYLGVPLHSKKLTVNRCLLLIEKILCRIKHWSGKLTLAGYS